MKYVEWSDGAINRNTLGALVAQFNEHGDEMSTVSVPVVDQFPVLEDMPAGTAVTQMSFDLFARWTLDWTQKIPMCPYVSPPLLIIGDDWSSEYCIPYIHVTLVRNALSYEPVVMRGVRPDQGAPGPLATHARIRNLREYAYKGGWAFISDTVYARAVNDLRSWYPRQDTQDQVIFLAELLANLARCASAFYKLSRGGAEVSDARLAMLNELSAVASAELLSKLTLAGNERDAAGFVERLVGTAQLWACEFELINSCGVMLWTKADRQIGPSAMS
jgi:hypothetical protein